MIPAFRYDRLFPKSPASASSVKPERPKEHSPVLEWICAFSPKFLEGSCDAFIAEPKQSTAAVEEAAKIDLALRHTHDPNRWDDRRFNSLSKAIIHDRPWLFQKLLTHPNIDVNAAPTAGWPPLLHAIRTGNRPAFKILLERNATVSRKAAQLATACGEPEMLDMLLDRSPEKFSVKEQKDWQKLAEMQKKLIRRMKFSWSNGEEYYANLESGQLMKGYLSAAVALRTGMTVDKRYANGDTMLHLAIRRSAPTLRLPRTPQNREAATLLMDLLINAGADLNRRNGKGDTPLMLALDQKNSSAYKMLRRAGASPSRGGVRPKTPGSVSDQEKQQPPSGSGPAEVPQT